jgi:hypothetical protein
MVRVCLIMLTLALVMLALGCTVPPANNGNNNGGNNNGGNNNGGEPMTITGAVTDSQGTADPTLDFTGGTVTITATLAGTIPEGTTVAAGVEGPAVTEQADSATSIPLTAGESSTYSGTYALASNFGATSAVYTFDVTATPPTGDPAAAAAGQATVSGVTDGPPSVPQF